MQTALMHQVPQRNRRAAFDPAARATHAPCTVRGLTVICRPGEPQAHLELLGYETLAVEGASALMLIPPGAIIGRDWLENFTREVVL